MTPPTNPKPHIARHFSKSLGWVWGLWWSPVEYLLGSTPDLSAYQPAALCHYLERKAQLHAKTQTPPA